MKPDGIVFLDIATSTGWGAGFPGGPPEFGTQRMAQDGDEDGDVYVFFRDWLEALIDRVSPAILCFESPYIPMPAAGKVIRTATGQLIVAAPKVINMNTIRRLVVLCGIAEEVGTRRKLIVREECSSSIAKVFAGSGGGRRPDKKAMVIRMCRIYGFDPKNDNEADALAGFIATEAVMFPMVYRGAGQLFARGGS